MAVDQMADICSVCNNPCVGPPIRVAGNERICMRCFRDRQYSISVAEYQDSPWRPR